MQAMTKLLLKQNLKKGLPKETGYHSISITVFEY